MTVDKARHLRTSSWDFIGANDQLNWENRSLIILYTLYHPYLFFGGLLHVCYVCKMSKGECQLTHTSHVSWHLISFFHSHDTYVSYEVNCSHLECECSFFISLLHEPWTQAKMCQKSLKCNQWQINANEDFCTRHLSLSFGNCILCYMEQGGVGVDWKDAGSAVWAKKVQWWHRGHLEGRWELRT